MAMSEASEGFMPDVLSCDLDGSMVSEKKDNHIGTHTHNGYEIDVDTYNTCNLVTCIYIYMMYICMKNQQK